MTVIAAGMGALVLVLVLAMVLRINFSRVSDPRLLQEGVSAVFENSFKEFSIKKSLTNAIN